MGKTDAVGARLRRIEGLDKVTGKTLFADDLTMEGMAYGKVLFTSHPHARIVSIDTEQARALPGVMAVLLARDVPANEYGLMRNDQPVLCGDKVRFVGDRIALVIAETEEIAVRARDLIEVKYQDLPVLTDPREAMKDRAPLVHDDVDRNIVVEYHVRNGDVEKALQDSDVVVESEYLTGPAEHAYLQPEAGLSYIDDEGRIVVHTAGQWAHDDRRQIAHALDIPEDRVRVIYPPVGGAFGGREDISVQILLALAAWKTGRPVRIVWTREESVQGHHKRHPFYITCKTGANRNGKLTAVQAELIADAGAYCSSTPAVLANAVLLCTGPYDIPNAKLDGYAVYTNNVTSGAMRAFGAPQGLFAGELQMAKLAEKLGLDPVELRARNLLHEGSMLTTHTVIPPGVGIKETLLELAQRSEWQGGRGARLEPPTELLPPKSWGVGVACGWKNVGYPFGFPEQCTAVTELYGEDDIEQIIIKCGAAEVGQGMMTILAQVAAQTLCVDPALVDVINDYTSVAPNAGSSSASRHALMAGKAVHLACQAAKKLWDAGERPAIATEQYVPPATSLYDSETGKCVPNFSYGYAAHAAEVEVDLDTGVVQLKRVYACHDPGKVINPTMVEGQIEGGVVMAQGWTLIEEFVQEDGHITTKTLADYLIPTIMDAPDEILPILVEVPDPLGPYGARGVGEMATMLLALAIVDAIHDATGIWFNELPVTAEKVLLALHEKEGSW